MPADYTNLPAHIATRVAVAAQRFLFDTSCPSQVAWDDLEQALREAREAERVTVENVMESVFGPNPQYIHVANWNFVDRVLRAAGYTVGE